MKKQIKTDKSENITRVKSEEKEIILVGTAHVSKESVEEVKEIIGKEKPDHVCVEIDATRYKSLTNKKDYSSLNLTQILKQRKGFLLISNLVLASFQKRLGFDIGIKPGEDMRAASGFAVPVLGS